MAMRFNTADTEYGIFFKGACVCEVCAAEKKKAMSKKVAKTALDSKNPVAQGRARCPSLTELSPYVTIAPMERGTDETTTAFIVLSARRRLVMMLEVRKYPRVRKQRVRDAAKESVPCINTPLRNTKSIIKSKSAS